MICPDGLSFINDYIESLNKILQQENRQQLTKTQRYWMKFVLLGILVTNSVCWTKMERFSAGQYSNKAISWMFRHGKIYWGLLLTASVKHIIKKYKIKNCVLGVDDSDKSRSKNATEIAKVHKIKDKKTAGYMNGQNIVFLV